MAKYIKAHDLYNDSLFTKRYRIEYTIFFVFVHSGSPGSWTLVEVYARNSVEAYIAVLDMGYTPLNDELQHDLIW